MTDTETVDDATLDFDYELDAAPEKVWRALTVPELVEAWLLPNTMRRAKPGERFTLDAGNKRRDIDCEILEATPPRRLSYSWRGADEPPAMVTFELTPTDDGGTTLRVIHRPLLAVPRAANGNAPTMALAA